MKFNWLSNGLGGQSMYLLKLAAEGRIPATLSITADTGSENDRVCSTGERMTAPDFFQQHVKPYAEKYGIEAVLVRAQDRDGQPLPPLIEILKRSSGIEFEELTSPLSVPLFTADRSLGRLRQSCTDKWKIRAIHQEARRRGAQTLRSAIGFHAGEASRVKAAWLETDGDFEIYKPLTRRDGKLFPVRWLEHYYPLIDLTLNRQQIRAELDSAKVPYLVTTECDHCPHQDYQRWAMHTPEVIEALAEIESRWHGKLFFTDQRIPLKSALERMRSIDQERRRQGQLFAVDFGCEEGAYCGI